MGLGSFLRECHHWVLSADDWGDTVLVRAFRPRMVCPYGTRCQGLISYSPSLSLWSNYQRSLPRMTAEVVVPYAVLIQYSTGCYTRVRRAVGTHSSVPNGVGTHSSAAIVSGQPALQSWLRMRMCRRASNKRERTRRSSHLARLACLRAVLPSEMRKARREREKRRALR
jgi:hypothetical protein